MIDIENDDYIIILNKFSIRKYFINENLCNQITIVLKGINILQSHSDFVYFKNINDYLLWKLKYNITRYIHEHQIEYPKHDYLGTWRILENV